MYDMEPWAIANFGTNETVTVPAQIKAWYGSHTSGTYGELGYSIRIRKPDTDIDCSVGPGSDTCKYENFQQLLRIIVQKGGRLCLRDSSSTD